MLYDIGVLFSSVLHLSMTIITAARPGLVFRESGSRAVITVSMYIGILLILGVITWLGYRGILTYSTKIITEYLTSRDVIQGLGAVFCVISAIVYLIRYSRQRRGMYFWYSLGLVMLAAGFFFVLRGFLASRVAWTGRAALYLGSIFFVIATWMGIAETKEPGTG
jgi:hypothetical protein